MDVKRRKNWGLRNYAGLGNLRLTSIFVSVPFIMSTEMCSVGQTARFGDTKCCSTDKVTGFENTAVGTVFLAVHKPNETSINSQKDTFGKQFHLGTLPYVGEKASVKKSIKNK